METWLTVLLVVVLLGGGLGLLSLALVVGRQPLVLRPERKHGEAKYEG
jgi:hypothetical protein